MVLVFLLWRSGVFVVVRCLFFVFEWSLCGVVDVLVFVSWCWYGVLLKVVIWWMNTR